MAKRKRKQSNRNRQRRKTRPDIIDIGMDKFSLMLAEEQIRQIKEETPNRYLETEFGKICIHPDAQILSISKPAVGVMFVDSIGESEEMDGVERLLFAEKMAERFPDEPLFANERAHAYIDLDKREKAKEIAAQNYELFKGYIAIDVLHGRLTFQNGEGNMRKELFGNKINPHDIYPDREYFTEEELMDYFALHAFLYADENEYDTARKMASLITQVSKEAILFEDQLLFAINAKQYPRRTKVKRIVNWIIVLSILGGIIWGIVALIRWIIGLF